jgi:hypothetical protein
MGTNGAFDRDERIAERLGLDAAQTRSLRNRVHEARSGRTGSDAAKHLGVTAGRFSHLLTALTDSPMPEEDVRDARTAALIILGSPTTTAPRPVEQVFTARGGTVFHSMAGCPALDDTHPRQISLTTATAEGRTKCLRCKEYEESQLLVPNPDENNIDPTEDRGSRSQRRSGGRRRSR